MKIKKDNLTGHSFKEKKSVWIIMLLVIVSSVLTAVDLNEAKETVLEWKAKPGNKIFELNRLLNKGDKVQSWSKTIIIETGGYLFLVDPTPELNWEHECEWVFIPQDAKVESIIYKMKSPPVTDNDNELKQIWGEVLDNTVSYRSIQNKIPNIPSNDVAPPNRKRHALLISGGYDRSNNHIRYWGDMAFMYRTLVGYYGFAPGDITICMADGNNPAVDRSNGTSSPTDLDGDGVGDYTLDSTRQTVIAQLEALSRRVGENDLVYIFTTDHGGWDERTGNCRLWLWNRTSLWDYEFDNYIRALPSSAVKVIMMEQCYSGGFIDDLGDIPNLVISTAVDGTHPSWAGDTYPEFNEFCYEWTAAVNWRYDDIYNTSPRNIDADSDNNQICEIDEAHNWAVNHDDAADNPQWMDNHSIGALVNLHGNFTLPGESMDNINAVLTIITNLLLDD